MHWQIRNPLPKPLMGSGLIEVDNIPFEKPAELFLMENQEMIQAFSPHASRNCCATQGSVGVRVTFTWIRLPRLQRGCRRKQRADGRKGQGRGGNHRPHPRHLCRMSAEERFPALPTRPFSTNVPHILLNRQFTHPNIQLEQFTADTFRSPKSVVRRHLFDQADRLGRESRLSRVCLGFAFPEHA